MKRLILLGFVLMISAPMVQAKGKKAKYKLEVAEEQVDTRRNRLEESEATRSVASDEDQVEQSDRDIASIRKEREEAQRNVEVKEDLEKDRMQYWRYDRSLGGASNR